MCDGALNLLVLKKDLEKSGNLFFQVIFQRQLTFRNIFSRLVKQFFVNQQMQYKIFVLGNNTSFITIRPRIDIFQNWSFLSKKKRKKNFFLSSLHFCCLCSEVRWKGTRFHALALLLRHAMYVHRSLELLGGRGHWLLLDRDYSVRSNK